MFKIQLSNPKILSAQTHESINIEDAIECIFPLETEFLIIIWNNIFIPLTYKYDISIMVKDFIKIVQFINNNKETKLEVNWASNTFASAWKLEKEKGNIIINSTWDSVIGGAEDILNKANVNSINKEEFKKEINSLLVFLNEKLKKSGIDFKKIKDIDSLNIAY